MKLNLNSAKNQKILSTLGENIKLARLRRNLSTENLAVKAEIGRVTFIKIEQGNPSVALGKYMQVLLVLGLENDLVNIAVSDPIGRKLQDGQLMLRKRAPRQKKD
ncbi:MAG: transcriptional regulator [Bacteroidota bacterium]|nr:transcriptional regulator [Bacteroidota bacterium]